MARPEADRGFRNQIITGLNGADYARLRADLVPVALTLRQPIEEPLRPIEDVYFPESGIVSVVAKSGKSSSIEVGLIGREGMTGIAIVLGDDRTGNESFVQMAGDGNRLPAKKLRAALETSPTLRLYLLRYVHAFLAQAMGTALANGRHHLEERLARWLLMAHDRGDTFSLPLTHEFIAMMLGVRRAGVTLALQLLEGRALIRARRGEIVVLDRKGLEKVAGDSYGTPEREMTRLLG